MSISGESRKGLKRGKYILHKTNPTSFKKGFTPWNKGKFEIPLEGEKKCEICEITFHYKISTKTNLPKTCSKECRYKSLSVQFKGKPIKNSIPYSRAEKKKAQRVVQRLVKSGTIKKEPCIICGVFPSQAHHYNGYNPVNWLDIEWYCDRHHKDEHIRLRKTGEALKL